TTIGALLAQDMGDTHLVPIYYISKALNSAELRYSPVEKACLPLLLAASKLRHYLLAHQTYVICETNPVTYLTNTPIQNGRIGKWALKLLEFSFIPLRPHGVRGQAIADLLAAFPGSDDTDIALFEEIAMAAEENPWQ
ncbi:hypothetical protein MKX03_018157, partial [Papaver bracteatum]